ncbi:MAG: hypothetical protein ACKOHI_09900, partial [Phycisphaerales bacterium]
MPGPRGVTVRLDPIARVAQAADGVPNVAPDGRSVAIEASSDAGWAVRVGDPPPPPRPATRAAPAA